MPRKYEDFTGQEINGLFVKELIYNSGGAKHHKKWLCECMVCHNDCIIQSNHLKTRKYNGCVTCANAQREDLVGRKFGHLFVDYMLPPEKYKRTLYSCTCDCGSTGVVVQANHLKSGETKSCGCLLSYPEEYISQVLTDNQINYVKQKTFPGLKYKNSLRFDFYLPDTNTVIEYNGEQHYKPIDFYGGEDNYTVSRERDEIKRQYCEDNDINYIVIRFDEDIGESLITNNIIMKR